MKKNTILAFLLGLLILGTVTGPLLARPAAAAVDFHISQLDGVLPSNTDPKTVVINIIKGALGVLSLVAVSFIIYGGFRWITAAGNEDSIKTAKDVISAAIIGLIIVLLSYAIVVMVGTLTQNAALGQPI